MLKPKWFLKLVLLSFAIEAQAVDVELVNVDQMQASSCYTGSRVDSKAPGGFATSTNMPQPLGKNAYGGEGQLSLVALRNEHVPFLDKKVGFRLLLVNRTRKEIAFPAVDSRISIIQQAKDENNEWRPIEFLSSSWCGNSYHQVFLPQQSFWLFAVPAYTGSFKTKLRFVLQQQPPIYSNEFDGSINPSQFTPPPVRKF